MTTKQLMLIILTISVLLLAGCASLQKVECPPALENLKTGLSIATGAGAADDIIEETATTTELEEDDDGLPRKTVTEGDLVDFPNLKATDPDGDPIFYTFSEPLDEDGTWKTAVGDAGLYRITITASDGENEIEQEVLIEVLSANKAPVINIDDTISAEEGDTISLDPEVTDADGDEVTVEFSGFMDSSTKKLGFDDAGTHTVVISASDGTRTTEVTVTIDVADVNRAPVLSRIRDITIDEGESVTVTPEATDPDGDDVTFTFSAPLDEDGILDNAEPGTYEITVTASDGDLEDSRIFDLVVESLNKPPVIVLDDVEVDEGETITLDPDVTDPDGDEVTVEYSGFMTGPTKVTDFDDAGEYTVTITASDGINEASVTITVTVNDVNRAPEFDPGAFI